MFIFTLLFVYMYNNKPPLSIMPVQFVQVVNADAVNADTVNVEY